MPDKFRSIHMYDDLDIFQVSRPIGMTLSDAGALLPLQVAVPAIRLTSLVMVMTIIHVPQLRRDSVLPLLMMMMTTTTIMMTMMMTWRGGVY
jgi:hypothetical protein